jgi:hypothetical protein
MTIVAVAALVTGYIPLTGFDHLHLHIDHGVRFFHDHLNIGHHEHGHHHAHGGHETHPARSSGDRGDGDGSDDSRPASTVVTLGHVAQVVPAEARLEADGTPLLIATSQPTAIERDESLHPSWQSRAPPV